MTPKPLAVLVSHTHWDRAWYLSFPKFRFRLVLMIDRILDLLDRDPEFRCFVLDGQVVLLEDYLELAPDREADLRRMVRAGRLVIGPWYVLPDLFLEDGEAVVRNLKLGLDVSARFGEPLRVGYVPDPFGHFAQLPQLLNGFGMETFIFMRGMPQALRERQVLHFDWDAPDGSSVRAYYLIEGYFNASALGHPHVIGRWDGVKADPERAARQLTDTIQKLRAHDPADLFLLNNGLDHMPEQAELPGLLRELRERLPDLEIEHGGFSDFMERLVRRPAQARYTGDLLDNPDHPILSSMLSTRVYLKQQNHRAQSRLVRYAEPFQALAAGLLGDEAPDHRRFLLHAWKTLLKNHPHDDICGCSVDEVHDANEVRFSDVLDVADSVLDELLEQLALRGFQMAGGTDSSQEGESSESTLNNSSSQAAADSSQPAPRQRHLLAFNPHPFPLVGTFRANVHFPNHHGEEEVLLPRHELALYDGNGRRLPMRVTGTQAPKLKAEFIQLTWGRTYTLEFEAELPPLGYKVFRVAELHPSPEPPEAENTKDAPSGGSLENDRFTVRYTSDSLDVRPAGSPEDHFPKHHFPEHDLPEHPFPEQLTNQFLRLEHELDGGDTYSFSRVDSRVRAAELRHVAPSPSLPRTLDLTYSLTAPQGLDQPEPVEQTIHVELHVPAQGALRLSVRYRNLLRDCRLRALVPAGVRTDHSWADGPFRIARHDVTPEQRAADRPERYASYPGELPYSTHFMGDFSFVERPGGATWLAGKGLHEYELVGDRLALTLHRSVGWLSVSNGSIRRPHAGPKVPTPGAQCQRELSAEFAYGTTDESAPESAPLRDSELPPVPSVWADIANQARAFCHPAWIREFPVIAGLPDSGPLPAELSLVRLSDPAVQLASLRLADASDQPGDSMAAPRQWVLRLYNPDQTERECRVETALPASRWCRSRLDEQWREPEAADLLDGTLTLHLPPYAIVTLLLRA